MPIKSTSARDRTPAAWRTKPVSTGSPTRIGSRNEPRRSHPTGLRMNPYATVAAAAAATATRAMAIRSRQRPSTSAVDSPITSMPPQIAYANSGSGTSERPNTPAASWSSRGAACSAVDAAANRSTGPAGSGRRSSARATPATSAPVTTADASTAPDSVRRRGWTSGSTAPTSATIASAPAALDRARMAPDTPITSARPRRGGPNQNASTPDMKQIAAALAMPAVPTAAPRNRTIGLAASATPASGHSDPRPPAAQAAPASSRADTTARTSRPR